MKLLYKIIFLCCFFVSLNCFAAFKTTEVKIDGVMHIIVSQDSLVFMTIAGPAGQGPMPPFKCWATVQDGDAVNLRLDTIDFIPNMDSDSAGTKLITENAPTYYSFSGDVLHKGFNSIRFNFINEGLGSRVLILCKYNS
jgi:hypothetical protein